MRAFHKQATTKHKIYENIIARQSGMDHSPVIHLETSIFNMHKSKLLKTKNVADADVQMINMIGATPLRPLYLQDKQSKRVVIAGLLGLYFLAFGTLFTKAPKEIGRK